MTLSVAINNYAIGNLRVQDLSTVAKQAIDEGYDSPTLWQLATAQSAEESQLKKLFSKSLFELGLSVPSSDVAALEIARAIATDVLTGVIAPYNGAKQLWDLHERIPNLTDLSIFKGLASEYEDDHRNREGYSQDIIEECAALLAK